ncbi:hypothetical protein AAFC00_006038 [Neodothiora populina]|uniref:Carrier domain-containing protein n=1 Tax=Neodothiora populina TaxID=2781224 RepID=A0ABR3P7H5_9PEZI
MGFKAFESPATLLQLLQRAALEYPSKGQVFLDDGLDGPETTLSYPELLSRATFNAGKLKAAEIAEPGKIVVVYFENHRDNVLWTWSVIAAGSVPAILSPLSNDAKTLAGQMENLATLFGSPTFITSEKNAAQFEKFPQEHVHTIETIDAQQEQNHHVRKDSLNDLDDPDQLAVLLFTSGSTGHSKAVEFTHRQLLCSAQAKKKMHFLDQNVKFMSWISFDHSANFCELHLNAMNVGASQISVPAGDFVQEPWRYYEIISRYKIGYTFSPNSFLAAASRSWQAEDRRGKGYDFSHLKVVMVGGEANRVSTMDHANQILRDHGARRNPIKAAYGLSETCSACFYNLRTPEWDLEHRNLFASVGHSLPIGIDLRVVDDGLQPVPHGSDGRIQLQGDIVFKRYYNNKEATDSCMTADGWFDTGDLGRLDEGNHLEIVGRSKEILIINGNNYSSFELEEAIESRKIPGLNPTWTATFSVWDKKSNSEGVVVLFNPIDESRSDEESLRTLIGEVSKAVLMFASAMPVAVIPLPKSEMPKSTIGKLSRQKLKKFYTEGHFDQYRVQEASPLAEGLKPLASQLQLAIARFLSRETDVPLEELGANVPIMQTGMNSIAYLRMKRMIEVEMNMTKTPIPMSLILQPRTIEGLEAAILEQTGKIGIYQPIATLQSGSKPALFLLPPGGGEFMIWLPLLKYLPDRPVYALRAKGLERAEGVFESMEDMLDIYEQAIRDIQPKGPYILLGLCFGGITAFELAKRFEAAGDEVGLVGGLDNPPWISKILTKSDLRAFTVEMLAYHRVIPRDQIEAVTERYAGVPEDEVVDAIVADFKGANLETMGLTAEKMEDWNRVNNIARRICKDYEPSGKVSKYEVFWVPPVRAWKISDETWDGWLHEWDVFTDELTFHRIAGDHFTMLDEGVNVATFEKSLNRIFAERGI